MLFSYFQVLSALLVAKPEQEQRLLSGRVNKLGDPDRKIAASVSHLLTLLGKGERRSTYVTTLEYNTPHTLWVATINNLQYNIIELSLRECFIQTLSWRDSSLLVNPSKTVNACL